MRRATRARAVLHRGAASGPVLPIRCMPCAEPEPTSRERDDTPTRLSDSFASRVGRRRRRRPRWERTELALCRRLRPWRRAAFRLIERRPLHLRPHLDEMLLFFIERRAKLSFEVGVASHGSKLAQDGPAVVVRAVSEHQVQAQNRYSSSSTSLSRRPTGLEASSTKSRCRAQASAFGRTERSASRQVDGRITGQRARCRGSR